MREMKGITQPRVRDRAEDQREKKGINTTHKNKNKNQRKRGKERM